MKDDEADLQGFRYFHAPARWVFETHYKVVSIASLLEKFMEEWKWGKKPLGWARNPENKEGKAFYDPITDWIVAPYRRNFYFVIERKFKDLFGPHACRLVYRPHQNESEVVWVAICQIKAMWHSDERMLAALQEAVNNEELWHSEETAQLVVIE